MSTSDHAVVSTSAVKRACDLLLAARLGDVTQELVAAGQLLASHVKPAANVLETYFPDNADRMMHDNIFILGQRMESAEKELARLQDLISKV